ncbi:hypothetical protein B0T16DRAFT_449835 [Cercophora newfieldiana]|uniref:Hsp70 family chaperone n=1 Tax=Cercophora newfieldiana TaxID=92897 RepID=A0AA39XRY4_9PEZI|nr:hypothetical protein B0T16DRAFT_449835 [Cercophora newfieldiana]
MAEDLKADLRIAVDFGTTYTGVAWIDPKQPYASPQVISDWPGSGGSCDVTNERKVPSVLGKHPTATGARRWGFLCDDEMNEADKWRYLKVFLEPRQLENGRKNNISWAPESMAQVHQLVSEYLHQVYQHIRRSISMRIGLTAINGEDGWDDMAIEFIFSVPTTWRGQDMLDDFQTIIKNAGFGVQERHEVVLGLTEAEAAAVASMFRVGSSIPFDDGDVFLSIDAGGGTTDLAFVKISSANPPVMEQVQDVRGTGIGSMMIDTSFRQLVLERLQKNPDLKAQLPADLPMRLSQSPYYRTQKHKFGDPDYDQEAYRIAIVGARFDFSCEGLGIEKGHMIVSKKEFEGLFNQQIERIFALLQEALDKFEKDGNKSIKYVILSGGLGSSMYILNRLQEYIAESKHASLSGAAVQMCAEPQLVVIKGLLLEQTNRILRTRIARASYGVVFRERYSKTRHFDPIHVIDPHDGKEYVADQVQWIVRRGERLINGDALFATVERRAALDEPLAWTETIVWSDNPDGCVPPSLAEPGVDKLFEVRADLTDIQPEKLVVKKKRHRIWFWKTKRQYYICRYDVHLAVGPAGDIRLAVKYQGEHLPGSEAPKKVAIKAEWDTASPAEEAVEQIASGLAATKVSLGSFGSSRASLVRSFPVAPDHPPVFLASGGR